ncbi:hypothetical protein ABGV49_09645 [Chromobacterium vaccinii]|uniref:Uncharacterized protein n=1 Tax=Chromobacterium vaccinii TaxID=1108595 RepID=A0ABV0FB63_9NEIS
MHSVKKICGSLLLVGIVFANSVYADTISVPCDQYVKITGNKLACRAIPVVKLQKEEWDTALEQAKLRDSGEADLPPWKRTDKSASKGKKQAAKEAEAQPDLSVQCQLPPWRREEGVKCPS